MATTTSTAPATPTGLSWLWDRQLARYPSERARTSYLAVTVLATIVLYYELYVQGAVAPTIIREYSFTFTQFVFVSVIGGAVGAFASLFAGLADRWGRANLIVGGLLLTALLILVGLPNAPSKAAYTVLFAVVSFIEGVVLVATPALVRDFSPQLGRGAAMGFWTLGPVLGSLIVTEVSSHTLEADASNWRSQFTICGITGLVVFVIALLGLRELTPQLRDQLMVSMRDRALIEARAAGINPEVVLRGHWRQMLRWDIVGPAFAISIFLLGYYMLVGFTVVYFATVFGYSEAQANALGNWYWITNAIALAIIGTLSDRVMVRKPFMVVGTLISIVGGALFAAAATHPQTGYYTFALYSVLSSAGGGMAYVAWMSAFTETVEKHNPAATATGLAVWGWIIRIVVTVSLAVFTLVVPATSTIVDAQGKYPQQLAVLSAVPKDAAKALQANPNDTNALAKALGAVAREQGASPATAAAVSDAVRRRASELATVNAIDPVTLAGLQAQPPNPAAVNRAIEELAKIFGPGSASRLLALQPPAVQADLKLIAPYGQTLKQAQASVPPAELASIQKAADRNPKQWQRWWWVCVAGQVLFLPFVFLLAGRWSPRRARRDAAEHDRRVQAELAALGRGGEPAAMEPGTA